MLTYATPYDADHALESLGVIESSIESLPKNKEDKEEDEKDEKGEKKKKSKKLKKKSLPIHSFRM